MSIKCDVLVIGAGPAGSSAARAAAKLGLKTIVIEEHKEIGNPVQCAEAIGSYLFQYMPFEIPKEQLKYKIEGVYLWANGVAVKKEGETWSGYAIDRKKWDKWIASLATKEGVEILTDTKLVSFEYGNNNKVRKVVSVSNKKKIDFEPKYIIGADGVDSTVIDLLGGRTRNSVGYVKSYEMKNLKLKYPRYEQLFFGEFAPRAYAYIFPLSETRANVGVGTIYENVNLDELFNNFINTSFVKNQLSGGKLCIEKNGNAPINDLIDKLVHNNVFLVGDSANQNIKPFIEGNLPGIICANILGKLIKNIEEGSANAEEYKNIIHDKFRFIKDSQPYANLVYGETKIESKLFNFILLALMSGIINPKEKEIEYYVNKGYDFLKGHILKNGGFIEKRV